MNDNKFKQTKFATPLGQEKKNKTLRSSNVRRNI